MGFEDGARWSEGAEVGLDRHVLRVGEHVAAGWVGTDGLLDLPWHGLVGPRGVPQPVAGLAGDPSSFVVLAPAGAGKSTVLQALRRREPRAVGIDVRAAGVDRIEEALESAIAAGGPVHLDALDEAGVPPGELAGVLARQLATEQARRVAWRLACRPASWTASLARVLDRALEGFEQLRLLPLDRQGVRALAAGVGADPDGFVEALASAHLARLAATPAALRAAAEQWQAGGRLPDDSLEAMRFALAHWLPGQGEGWARPLIAADRQQRIARRVGAIAVFSDAERFAPADAADDGVASVAELPGIPEPGEPHAPVTTPEYRSVLDGPLFEPAAEATVAFRDRDCAEFLAAAYLVERRVDPDRLHHLLGVQADGRVAPRTAGLAAWLTALAPRLTADLLAANAVALAREGLDLPCDDVTATIVDHLLDGATLDSVDAAQDVDLGPLAHPGLADQLHCWLQAGLGRSERLWWLARLAVAGGCRGLVEPLLVHALEPGWASWARGAAVGVVTELGEPAQVRRLRGLLHLSEREDPDDELLALALTALYPDVLGTAELLDALRPPRNRGVLGVYWTFLQWLPDRIPDRDLCAVLAWLVDHLEGNLEDFDALAEDAIERAFEVYTRSGSEPLLSALAALVCRAIDAGYLSTVFPGAPPWSHGGAERRRLAVAVAERLATSGNWQPLTWERLVKPGDTAWLLEALPTLPEPAQPPLAACVPFLARRRPTREDAERILTLPVAHPAYEATINLREPCPLAAATGEDRAEQPRRRGHPKPTLGLLDRLAERAPTVAAAVCRQLHGRDGDVGTRAS